MPFIYRPYRKARGLLASPDPSLTEIAAHHVKQLRIYLSGKEDDGQHHLYFSGYLPSVEEYEREERARLRVIESMKRMKENHD